MKVGADPKQTDVLSPASPPCSACTAFFFFEWLCSGFLKFLRKLPLLNVTPAVQRHAFEQRNPATLRLPSTPLCRSSARHPQSILRNSAPVSSFFVVLHGVRVGFYTLLLERAAPFFLFLLFSFP